jgi:CheY-like chemotaxis protein
VKILYVEDMPLDAELVQRYIDVTPHELVIATTLDAARQALQNNPDLILLDVVLNDTKSGYGFVRELRTQHFTHPIIAVTALALPKDIEQCYEAGFTAVLVKPFELKHLAALLAQYA